MSEKVSPQPTFSAKRGNELQVGRLVVGSVDILKNQSFLSLKATNSIASGESRRTYRKKNAVPEGDEH